MTVTVKSPVSVVIHFRLGPARVVHVAGCRRRRQEGRD